MRYFMFHQSLVKTALVTLLCICLTTCISAQNQDQNQQISKVLPDVLESHRQFVSIPNVSANREDMYKNIEYVTEAFEKLNFDVRLLESESLPVFLAEKRVSNEAKTILFYLHLDGQPADPDNWAQEDPFVPVLKAQDEQGMWNSIEWSNINNKIDPEWRIFGRAAADDKGPITMMLTALRLMKVNGQDLKYNVKIILDLQEEASSHGFLSTMTKYKADYEADYMIIMDGPAHPSNKPTLTFGCRGIATCNITIYGAKLPQHSGHYGNYAPNPVFSMSHLLASIKDEQGKVLIKGFYDNIELDEEAIAIFDAIPDDEAAIKKGLGIAQADQVGNSYQEALQYPSFNVRHIETSWKGPGLKTVIPEIITAHIDVRLVKETDGKEQMSKVKKHIESQGYYVIDREPTDEERLTYPKIAKFISNRSMNAFRTEMDDPFGKILIEVLEKEFGEKPIRIRTMGGTVPILPAITTLDIPAIIVPMVNMDNNQHNPNENLRIGNMIAGIKICMSILSMEL